jgi:hypothetical protein
MSEAKVKKNYLSHMGNFGERKPERGRAKSTSNRKHSNKMMGSKIQLPSLGTQFFLISTSNKNINKKF